MEIDRKASGAEIKHAYRKLAKRFHPDVSADSEGERKFKDVAEAYRTLKYPASRAAYDGKIQTRFARADPHPNINIAYPDWLTLFANPLWAGYCRYWSVGFLRQI
jgi:curved DNA-binding protein